MERLRRLLKIGGLSLAALVMSCKMPEQRQDRKEASSSSEIAIAPAKNKKYRIQVVPFAAYNPSPTTSKFINLNDNIRRYLDEGLDRDLQVSRESFHIEEYFSFENMIYDISGRLGYVRERIQEMSPREAIQLTCDIIAQRMNYFGTTQDFRARMQRRGELKRTEETLNAVLESSEASKEEKENARKKQELLREMEIKWMELERQESRLRDGAGYLTRIADDLAIDKLLKEQRSIVCRHYAKIAENIFFVLKNKNPNLMNTRVCSYSDRNHRWNQVSTVYQEGNETHIAISFFDPTWFDVSGHIEGYDDAHFPNNLLLTAQVNKLQGEVVMQPVAYVPRMRFR